MKPFAVCAGLLASTLGFTAGFLWIEPFDRANDALDWAFDAAPAWTQVTNYVRDPHTQDMSHGGQPRAAFQALAEYWNTKPGAPKVMIVGNSQTFSMSLAPGEQPQQAPELVYSDWIARHFAAQEVLCYRLGVAGLSYTEVLYYLDYLGSAGIKLTMLVVQVNYQSFWNGGIRDSLLDLLSEPAFRGRVESRAHSSESYAPIFQDALKQYQERQERAPKAGEATARGGFGAGIEDTARGWLEHLPLYQSRPAEKQAFDQMLYRGRLYFLHIKPSTARSITGPRLERNQAALDAVAATCRETSVTLALFTAPVNPLVSLYATPENKSNFSGFVRGLSKKYDLPLFDFEATVSADLWGRQYNGPDPLHMGRKAHQLVAEEMIAAIQAALPARREVR